MPTIRELLPTLPAVVKVTSRYRGGLTSVYRLFTATDDKVIDATPAEEMILNGEAAGYIGAGFRGVDTLLPLKITRCTACKCTGENQIRTVFGEHVCSKCYHATKSAYSYSPGKYYAAEERRFKAWEKRNPLSSFATSVKVEFAAQ